MDDQFIFRLKEFHTLENAQVVYYTSQANSAEEEYYGYVFKKLAEIEQKHVDFFKALIEKSGEAPPDFIELTTKFGMKIIGESAELNGKYDVCTLGAKFETKAIEMYTTFIDECNQKNYKVIKEALMEFRLEEEFHKLWLLDYANAHPK